MNKLALIAVALFLYACSNNQPDKHPKSGPAGEEPATEAVTDKPSPEPEAFPEEENAGFQLNTFTTLPNEIDGCTCNFHLSKQDEKEGKYLFVSDLATIAFVSIDGKIEKFALKEHAENSKVYLYAKGSYQLKIEIAREEYSEEEVVKMAGVMTLSKGKDALRRRFVGTCGC